MEELVCETSGPRERIIGRIITRSKEGEMGVEVKFGDFKTLWRRGPNIKVIKTVRGAEARLRAPTFGEKSTTLQSVGIMHTKPQHRFHSPTCLKCIHFIFNPR